MRVFLLPGTSLGNIHWAKIHANGWDTSAGIFWIPTQYSVAGLHFIQRTDLNWMLQPIPVSLSTWMMVEGATVRSGVQDNVQIACLPDRSPIHWLVPINGRGEVAMWRFLRLVHQMIPRLGHLPRNQKVGWRGESLAGILLPGTSETQKLLPQTRDRYPECGGHSRMGTDKSIRSTTVPDVDNRMFMCCLRTTTGDIRTCWTVTGAVTSWMNA